MVETTDIEKFVASTSDSVRVLAFFRAKRGKGKELEKVLLSIVGPTRGELGNISYVLHSMEGDPDRLLFDEIWVDKKALDEHLQKPYLKSLPKKIGRLICEPVRTEIYYEVR